jgi:peptide/nickel transport system substrate-binding protein
MLKAVFASALAGAVAATVLVASPVVAQAAGTEITIVLPEAPDKLDPCSSVLSQVGRIIKQNVTETLTRISSTDGSITPELAESWDQTSPETWQFHLRKGIKFHDGAPFNADAVVHTIKRLMNKDIVCSDRSKALAGLELTAKAIDENTVEITGDAPMPIFPTMMGMIAIVSPNTPDTAATREPIGTGPYRLASWTPDAVVLEQFDGYWGDKPQITKATYVFRSDSAVRAAMVETGEADLAPEISVTDATNPQTDFSYFNSETTRFRINTDQPPLNDLRIRKALNLAVDRDALHGTIFSKDAVPSTQLVVPAISGYNPNIPLWKHDPEEAKKLIAEAKADGVPVDQTIHMIGRIGMYANSAEAAEALMSMWQDVGFNVDLKMLEVGEWLKYEEKPYPENEGPVLVMDQVDNNFGDAVFTVFNKYHSKGATSAFDNAELDAAIEKAQAATGDERKRLWQEVFEDVEVKYVLGVPLFHMVGYTRVGPRLDWRPSLSTVSEIQLASIKLR